MHNEALVDVPDNAGGKHGRYDTHMITDDSVAFIERHQAEPFFLYTAYNSPISPARARSESRSWRPSCTSFGAHQEPSARQMHRVAGAVVRLHRCR